MKTIKLLLVAAMLQFSFGAIAQTNHVFDFVTANQEYNLHILEYDTITVINGYQVGDFHYGYPGSGLTVLESKFNVQIGEEICKLAVTFSDTISSFYVFFGSNPGVPFAVNFIKQYLDVEMLTSDSKFSIHPNPTSDYLRIECENFETVSIFNISGKLVLKDDSKSKEIDISQLSSGTYLVKIGSESQRFIIE